MERIRWLDELACAIAQAQQLTWRLGVLEGDSEEARTIYARLETVLGEVEALRVSDWADIRQEIDPKWLDGVLGGVFVPALPAR